MVGLSRLELLTSRLSGVRSNQLSYRPILDAKWCFLCPAVSFSQILRSTYLSVRLPWILLHSLPYAKLSLCLVLPAKTRSLRLTVSCHQILRSTYLSVRLPWICCHSLLSIKAFASLNTTYIGLHPIRKRWWRRGESNSWPPACKAGALPAELRPHFMMDVTLKTRQCKT